MSPSRMPMKRGETRAQAKRSLFFATLASAALLIVIAGAIAYFSGGPIAERISAPFMRVSN